METTNDGKGRDDSWEAYHTVNLPGGSCYTDFEGCGPTEETAKQDLLKQMRKFKSELDTEIIRLEGPPK